MKNRNLSFKETASGSGALSQTLHLLLLQRIWIRKQYKITLVCPISQNVAHSTSLPKTPSLDVIKGDSQPFVVDLNRN